MDLDEEFQQASQNQNSTAWNNSRQKSRSRSRSRTRSYSRSRSRSCSYSSSSRSRSRGSSYCSFSNKRQRSRSRSRGRSRSGTPDIPIRRGSPSFLEKRRITRYLSWIFYNFVLIIRELNLVFYYQNCSDLLWEKIVLVIEKNFWKSRL